MKKIKELTSEQEKNLIDFQQEWLNIGYSTERLDKKKVEEAITEVYGLINQPVPKIIFCQSPRQICILPELFRKLGREVTLEEMKELEHGVDKSQAYNNYYWLFQGSWGLYWVAFYEFPEKYIPDFSYSPEVSQQLAIASKLAKAVGGFVPFENFCFVSEKPVQICVDDQGRLHNEIDSALKYADGFEIHAIHGVRVPPDIITNRGSISLERIDGETNGEVKRVMLELYGWDKYIQESGAEVIDECLDQLGFPLRLLKKDLGESLEPAVMLEMTNSTIEGLHHGDTFVPDLKDGKTYHKKYLYPVPPFFTDEKGKQTPNTSVRKSHAYHCGFPDADEIHFIQQT